MLEILRPGILTTVQDLGRSGWRHLGVAQGGALDAPALMLANRLLDNPAGSAGLEVVAGPLELRLQRAGWLAICGADFDATLDGQPLAPGWRVPIQAGQRLLLRGPKRGQRAYLALDGGIAVPVVLGARATDLAGRFGGHLGRALQAGDCLPLGPAKTLTGRLGALQPVWTPELRVLPGPEYAEFSAAARHAFWSQDWTVTPHSNRMGYRLQGPQLERNNQRELLSHAVLPGVIQVPPNGQPIVLLADAQTTGGYPRLGVVIQADLWKLAQAPPGSRLCFVETDLAGAAAARRRCQQERYRFEWSAYGN